LQNRRGCRHFLAPLIWNLQTMRFEEYRKHDAVSLAELIAKREVSAKEVLEAAIALNPAINAIVHKQYDQARRAISAGLPEGPLKGVPYLIKDLGFFETGEPATFGSRLFKDLSPITKQPL
jgi:amidase